MKAEINLNMEILVLILLLFSFFFFSFLSELGRFVPGIRLSEKFLSFHKVIIDEQQFLFYIILLN